MNFTQPKLFKINNIIIIFLKELTYCQRAPRMFPNTCCKRAASPPRSQKGGKTRGKRCTKLHTLFSTDSFLSPLLSLPHTLSCSSPSLFEEWHSCQQRVPMPSAADVLWQPRPRAQRPAGASIPHRSSGSSCNGHREARVYRHKHTAERDNN